MNGGAGGNGSNGVSGTSGSSGASGTSTPPAMRYSTTGTCNIFPSCASITFGAGACNAALGGNYHIICATNNSPILGGLCNCVCCTTNTNTGGVVGGCCNFIGGNGSASTILGGSCNHICALDSHIFGGFNNCICSGAHYSLISGSKSSQVNVAVGSVMGMDTGIGGTTHYSYFETIVKNGGSFNIPHPDPLKNNTHRLVHTFVESPTAGDNLYRYEIEVINGVATLELPSYFKWLNKDIQIKISPKNHFGIAIGVIDSNIEFVNFTANQDGKYNVLIFGTRKDKKAIITWAGVERIIPLT